MSITLLCLVKGNKTANAFAVDIDSGKLVSHLKDAIKAKKSPVFDNIPADELKLWKVPISDDHVDPLSNLSLEDSEELLAIRKISKYFPDSLPEEHIHVLVSPPETTATSDEVLKLREEVASLQALLNKSEYEFDVIVSPRRTNGFKWIVNIEEATLEGLKNSIREMNLGLPALENDGAVLNFTYEVKRYSPRNDHDFRKMLRQFVSKNNFRLVVSIETPSKAFSDWTSPKMCQLYGLGESDDPSLSIRNIVSEFDLEKKFAGLKESSDLEDEKQKSETTNVKDFAVKLGLDKFTKNKEEWKKFYDFAGSDFVWPQPPDINERRLIFDYVVDPYWEPIGSELAVNALEYRRLLDSGSLDQSREYVLIVHGKFVRYGSSEEEKKMRVDYPGCYYVPVKERIVELRRFSASDANTNAGAEKEWQVHIRLRNTDDNLDEAGMANVEQGFRMIIDTGATTTVIPDFVRKKLNAQDGWNVSASKC